MARLSLPHIKMLLMGIALVAFLAVASALVSRFLVEEPPKPAPELPATPDEADSVLKDFVYTSTDKHGATEWTLTAATAIHYEDKNIIEFDRVTINLYSKEGRTYTVSAAKGTVNTETQDLTASGDIIGTSDDGIRFRTDSLEYSADLQEVRTEDVVFLESPQFNLEGQGMVMELEKEKVYLLRNVRALGKGD